MNRVFSFTFYIAITVGFLFSYCDDDSSQPAKKGACVTGREPVAVTACNTDLTEKECRRNADACVGGCTTVDFYERELAGTSVIRLQNVRDMRGKAHGMTTRKMQLNLMNVLKPMNPKPVRTSLSNE